jgi:hypothetical protein
MKKAKCLIFPQATRNCFDFDVPQPPACNSTALAQTISKTYADYRKAQKEKEMQNITLQPSIRIDAQTPAKFDATQQANDHLLERLSAATEDKLDTARHTFGLVDDDRPETAQELIDRITSGKFIVPEDRKNQKTWGYPLEYIRWRDPAIKRDEDGFQKYETSVEVASDDVMDTIIVKGPDAGLDAVNAFKAKTFN